MSARVTWLVGALAAALALAYGVKLLLELRAATAPPSPRAFVQASWSVYRFGPGHKVHAERLGLDCTACHSLAAEGKFDAPAPSVCVSCHEQKSDIDHALVDLDRAGGRTAAQSSHTQVADCVRCHGFGPDPEQKATDCLSCHNASHGQTPAVVIHAEDVCTKCHDVHENRVTPLECTKCHELTVVHARADAPVAAQCLDCHRAHGSALLALDRCADCHGAEGERPVPASATFEGHSCTGCHRPHEFGRSQVQSCTSCHTSVHVLEAQAHGECSSCHTPHAVRESVQGNVCVNCHRDVSLTHGESIAPAQACTSCHVPHADPAAKRAPQDCATCHAQIGRQGSTAHAGSLACTQCHVPHGFALAGTQETACSGCHGDKLKLVSQQAGHAACTSCHQNVPHGTDLSPVSCTNCHKDVRTRKGHSTCTSCHEPHSAARTKTVCSDCHRPQAQAAIHPKSAKLACLGCHTQHEGGLLAGVGDCSACHKVAALPGLHEVKHHQSCTTCHKPHEDKLPGAREGCLSCHRDMQDHQPEAQRCEGCHLFEHTPGARRLP